MDLQRKIAERVIAGMFADRGEQAARDYASAYLPRAARGNSITADEAGQVWRAVFGEDLPQDVADMIRRGRHIVV